MKRLLFVSLAACLCALPALAQSTITIAAAPGSERPPPEVESRAIRECQAELAGRPWSREAFEACLNRKVAPHRLIVRGG